MHGSSVRFSRIVLTTCANTSSPTMSSVRNVAFWGGPDSAPSMHHGVKADVERSRHDAWWRVSRTTPMRFGDEVGRVLGAYHALASVETRKVSSWSSSGRFGFLAGDQFDQVM